MCGWLWYHPTTRVNRPVLLLRLSARAVQAAICSGLVSTRSCSNITHPHISCDAGSTASGHGIWLQPNRGTRQSGAYRPATCLSADQIARQWVYCQRGCNCCITSCPALRCLSKSPDTVTGNSSWPLQCWCCCWTHLASVCPYLWYGSAYVGHQCVTFPSLRNRTGRRECQPDCMSGGSRHLY